MCSDSKILELLGFESSLVPQGFSYLSIVIYYFNRVNFESNVCMLNQRLGDILAYKVKHDLRQK